MEEPKDKILSVAKYELDQRLAEAEQRAELSHSSPISEKITGADAFAIRQKQYLNNPSTKLNWSA